MLCAICKSPYIFLISKTVAFIFDVMNAHYCAYVPDILSHVRAQFLTTAYMSSLKERREDMRIMKYLLDIAIYDIAAY